MQEISTITIITVLTKSGLIILRYQSIGIAKVATAHAASPLPKIKKQNKRVNNISHSPVSLHQLLAPIRNPIYATVRGGKT